MASIEQSSLHSAVIGLKVLYEPLNGSQNLEVIADIVAIPGIGADADRTWRREDCNWLSNSQMLPSETPQARILRFAYESQWLGSEAIQQRLPLVVDQLLTSLIAARQNCPERPIIFIGHCFGGLVIQKAIISSRTHSKSYQGICNSVCGIIFLGTPHRGSNSQSKAAIIATIASAMNFGEHSSLLRIVQKDSDALKDLLHDFTRIVNAENIPLVCFFEQHKSNVSKIITPKSMRWLTTKMEIVVDEDSGCIDGFPKLGLAADHFNMHRFPGPEDGNYRLVCSEVSRLAHAAPKRMEEQLAAATNYETRADTLERRDQECLSALFVTNSSEDMEMIEMKTDKLIKDANSWVLNHATFNKWLNQGYQGVLWIHGDPGKGKTFIAISLIREMMEKLRNQEHPHRQILLYFFCDSKDNRRNTAIVILRGLLYQLFCQRSDLCHILRSEYEKRKKHLLNSPTTLHTLWNILQTAANSSELDSVHVVIDALDECESESAQELLSLITASATDADEHDDTQNHIDGCTFKWLVTSRREENIRSELFESLNISLEENEESVNDAVSQFITIRVAQLKKAKRYSDTLAQEVQAMLREKAQGTFLWVALACREVAKPKVRSINTKAVLATLPLGLTPLYDRILDQILSFDDQDLAAHARNVLKAMAVAFRPLNLREIAVVARLPEENRQDERMILEYLELCSSIIAVRSGIAHFVHESARAYLRSKADVMSQDISISHTEVALACFEYICDDATFGNHSKQALRAMEDEHQNYNAISHLEYPVLFWLDHARLGVFHIQHRINVNCKFLQSKSASRQRWLDFYWCRKHPNWEKQPSEFEAIHLAAYGGLTWLIGDLVTAQGLAQITLKDSLGQDALIWAAIRGWNDTVVLLLDKSASTTVRNNAGLTALYLAASNGHLAVVSTLVRGGADVNCCDMLGSTLLHIVASHNYMAILLFLLKSKAKIDARDHLQWTAVQRACSSGNLAAVKIFKEWGADMKQMDREGMTLLHYAAAHGHTDVVTFLLQNGDHIDTKCYEQWTPLHEASWSGEEAVVEFLLKSGSDCAQRTKEGHTPLHLACWNGFFECVKILLKHGASVRDLCYEGETALHQATWRGHIEIVQELIYAGSQIGAKNRDGRTAMDYALANDNKVVVEILQKASSSLEGQYQDLSVSATSESTESELPSGTVAFTDVHRNDQDPPVELDPAIAATIPGEPVTCYAHHHGHAGFSVPLKIEAQYQDGSVRHFFCKTYGNAPMFTGEFHSLKILSDIFPTLCPRPLARGTMQTTDHSFLLTEYLDADPPTEKPGSGWTLAQKLAKMHSSPVVMPKDYTERMFGFPLTTFCGSTPQDNTFTKSWAYFFGYRRLDVIGRICEERHGADEELRMWLDRMIEHVVPALLADGHLGGARSIQPSLVHGDLWMGNRAKGLVEGWDAVEEICFDPSSVYAHNEYEFGIMRLFGGYLAGFWSQYHDIKPKTEPREEYEDRISLYSVYHLMNHYAMYSGGWKDDAIDTMKELWEKYQPQIPTDAPQILTQ